MPMGTETPPGRPNLAVSREPVGPKSAGDKGTVGDKALTDAVLLITVCWLALILLWFSVRRHNV